MPDNRVQIDKAMQDSLAEHLLRAICTFKSPRILVVGDFMLDAYMYGDVTRISPEAPVPILTVSEHEYRCGGAGSVAAMLASLRAMPVCVGMIGDDTNADALMGKLMEFDADVSGLVRVPGRPTTLKQRFIGLAQHRHKQQLIRVDSEDTEPASRTIHEKMLRDYRERLSGVDLVCLQDYGKGGLSSPICEEMILMARDQGLMVLVDPARGDGYAKYEGATLLKPNRFEAGAAVGFAIEAVGDAAKAGQILRRSLGLDAVLITLDKEGMYMDTATTQQLVPAKSRAIYDVTGAGDVVLATLAMSLASGQDYLTSAHLANVAGGIAVGKFGTAVVTIPEMIREITHDCEARDGKLRSIDALLHEIGQRRARGERVVFTNGCFDVLHRGHIEYLRSCRLQGDVVVVGVNSDRSVRALKGPTRPVNNQDDRVAVLSSLECVDLVTIFDEVSVLGLVKKIRPDVLVKGGDYGKEGVVGWDFVESYGGRVFVAPLVSGKSSTATIEKMSLMATESVARSA